MIIEQKVWDDMRATLAAISMPLMAHQQVAQLLQQVERLSASGAPSEGQALANGEDRPRPPA